MKSDEIDDIIAKALEENKQQHRHQGSKKDKIQTARKVLNIIFMVGFVAAVIIYFALPEQRVLFFSVGFGAMAVKIVEFFLRFMF